MKYIVNFSGGLCSFWAAHRCVQRFGKENVILLFADTLIEDPDLHAFNGKAVEILGCKFFRVSRGLTPWQLFRREGLIANNQHPICSKMLKRELLDEWAAGNFEMIQGQENFLQEPATVVIGFDWNEEDRLTRLRAAKPGIKIIAPMLDEPIWDKCRMQDEARKIGLPECSLYQEGFPHNNCGGTCVRAGFAHWAHLLVKRPQRYAEWEREELDTIDDFLKRGIDPLTILKDRRGGTTKNLTLRAFRLRVEAGEEFDRTDWGGCGCGGVS